MCGCNHFDHFPLYQFLLFSELHGRIPLGRDEEGGIGKEIAILLILTSHIFIYFLINLFNWRIIIILWWVFFSCMHQHESATGVLPSPHLEPTSPSPLHLIPLGCPGVLALGALPHALNLAAAICFTCDTRFSAVLSNHPTLAFSHWVQKFVLYICVSFATLHVGSLLRYF